jgi:DNA-binding IclR family transcriptional regulator
MNENYTIQVLERTSEIIDVMTNYPKGISLADICNASKLNKTTVFRILANLQQFGYATQDIQDGKYRLGFKFVEISTTILAESDIRNTAHAYLEKLSSVTSEVVHLIVLDGYEGVYIDKVHNSSNTIRMLSRVGKHLLLHCTSAGKVLMSGMSETEIDNVIRVKGLIKKTENTITNRDTLMKELIKVKAQGYAEDDIENEEGIRCLAAPIYNYKGEIAAVVSIAGVTLRVTKQRLPELAFVLKDITSQITKEFGGKPLQ